MKTYSKYEQVGLKAWGTLCALLGSQNMKAALKAATETEREYREGYPEICFARNAKSQARLDLVLRICYGCGLELTPEQVSLKKDLLKVDYYKVLRHAKGMTASIVL